MMRILSPNIENRMKTLGWYQIAGGIYGFYIVIKLIFKEEALTGALFLLSSLAIILFLFSIYCGNLLRKANIRGLLLSNLNQAIQIIQFGVLSIGFAYYSGIRIAFGFDWGETFIPDGFFSFSGIALSYTPSDTSHLIIWINIVPIFILYLIWKIENDIKERKELIESAEISSDEKY
jgi:hypothetical protein